MAGAASICHGWQGPVIKQPGRKYDSLVQTVDILPTIMEIAHGKKNIEKTAGTSFYKVLTQPGFAAGDKVYGQSSILQSKRSRPPVYQGTLRSIRSGDFKLIYHLENGVKELYNLKDDPAELHNLYDINRDIADTLFIEMSQKFKLEQVETENIDVRQNLESLKSLGYN